MVSLDDLSAEILDLKKQIGATILAHYYQEGEIQALADITGDSLKLAREATKVTNPVMGAETKKLAELKAGEVPSYGADYRMSGKEPHVITVQVRRPQNPRTVEAAFEYKGAKP